MNNSFFHNCLKSILLAAFVLLVVLFTACQNSMVEINKVLKLDTMPEMFAKNIDIYYTDSSVLRMKTFAPELLSYNSRKENPTTLFPKGIKAIFYDKEGKAYSDLKADWAKYFKNKKLWEAKYNVVIVNIQGDTLRTEHLFADEEKQILYTQKFVRITTADGSDIQGKGGFRSNVDFTDYEFISVSGDVNND